MKSKNLLRLVSIGVVSVALSNAYALKMIDPNVPAYDYILFPSPGPGGVPVVWCFRSTSGGQVIASLWQGEESAFHSTELIWATNQINDVLRRVSAANHDPTRELSFIRFGGRHFLVWAKKGKPASRRHALLRSTDSVSKIAKTFNIDMQGYNGAQGTGRAFLELGGIMYCFEYPFPDCEITWLHDGSDMLWEASQPTASHPAELIDATKTITGILKKAATTSRDPNRHLCLISYNDRLFLTWSEHMDKRPRKGITRGSGKRAVYKALKLHSE
jgi:hypothetical protein